MEVVEEVENEATQMSVEGCQLSPPIAVGEVLRQPLPPIEFGRIAADRQAGDFTKGRDAERVRQFAEYKDRVGEIVVGTVKRAESYSITVDLGRARVIRREEMIPRENLRQGTGSVPISLMCVKNRAARKSSCRGPVMNLWLSSLPRSARNLVVLSKSKVLPVNWCRAK